MAGSAVKRYGIITLLLAGLGAGGWLGWTKYAASKAAPAWRTAKVEKGAITASVSATGTLNPVRSVQIGSQVSGQLKELYVDFNDVVKEGQIVALIDPESFELRVRQAQADLEAARATVGTQQAAVGAQRASVSREEVNLADSRRDLERKLTLFDKGFISAAERDRAQTLVNASQEQLKTTRAQLAVAEAQAKNAEAIVKQRDAQLAQARVDLERTAIRAPVDGVIIKRSVDAGQTVAASLQAPELFILARNLTDMQVDASIDEAEVGRLKEGQRSTFTVDSFPGRIFSGEILQVRKSARVVQNVVTYVAVISAANADLSLLPGMTANLRVITDQRADVLKIPNAALRFRPAGYVDAPAPASPAAAGPGLFSTAEAAQSGGEGDAPGVGDSSAKPAKGAAPRQGDAGPQGGGSPLRQRLVQELKLDAAQQSRLDSLLAAQRDKVRSLRALPEGERGKAAAQSRAELRAQIGALLKPEQQARYGEIMEELAARARASNTGGAVLAQADEGGKGAKTATAKGAEGGKSGRADARSGQAAKATEGAQTGGAPRAAAGVEFRQRLVTELKLDGAQQERLEQIFSAQRLSPQALRGMAPPERGKAAERARAELRMQIYEILKPEQRQRYAEIVAEAAGRQAARGRVFVLDGAGQPRAVAVRLGLSDGAMTEVLAGELKEGQLVLVGTVGAPAVSGPSRGGAGKGPGLPVAP